MQEEWCYRWHGHNIKIYQQRVVLVLFPFCQGAGMCQHLLHTVDVARRLAQSTRVVLIVGDVGKYVVIYVML